MIGKTISHYQILSELGRGGMGVVYKALDTKLGREVAIKVLPQHLGADAEATKRFVNEAKAASSLDHPHIGAIHEINETKEGLTYIVMAYYEGETLRARIDRGRISVEESLRLTAQIAKGLVKAHQKNIIHRDIKPSNVIITADGDAKLLDFGLAKLAGATKVTRTGTTLGTAAYMSPEQARGEEVDARSDIWSLGVMLYEMLSGRQPFRGEYEPAVIYSILNEEPPSVASERPEVVVELENVLDRALAKKPAERYQTMQEFLGDIETQEERVKLGAAARGPLAIRRKVRRRIVRIGVPAVLGAVAVAALIIFNPFEIEIRPKTKEAIARENSIVVMPFENLMDPEDVGIEAAKITSLLTTGLAESEYMQVVSSDRLYDVLKQLGAEDERVVSRKVAEEVAKRTKSNWVLTGKLLQTEPNIVVVAEVKNAVTGEVRGKAAQVRADVGMTIFDVVDRLKVDLGKELALPQEAMAQLDVSVEDVTTSSPEALRHYINGYALNHKGKWSEAAEEFRQAIGCDSTFATAYAGLAHMIELTQSRPEDYRNELSIEELIEELDGKAKQYSFKLPWRERMDIELTAAWHAGRREEVRGILETILNRYPQDKGAWFNLGEFYRSEPQLEKAIECFDRAIEIDSLDAPSYTCQAFCFNGIDRPDKAIETVSKAIALAPDEAAGYHARSVLYMLNGRAQEAIHDLEKMLSIESERTDAWFYLGVVYLFKRQYEKAEEIFRTRAGKSENLGSRKFFRRSLAFIPTYQGKLDDALTKLDNAIAFDCMESEAESGYIHLFKALIHLEKKNYDLALDAIDRKIELGDTTWYTPALKIYILEKAARHSKAKAAAGTLRAEIGKAMTHPDQSGEPHERSRFRASWALGIVELATGNVDSAIIHIENALESIRGWEEAEAPVRFFLAEAYLKKGRLRDAAAQWERNLRTYYLTTAMYSLWMATAQYKLALVYEELGEREKAIEHYEKFLEIWNDADPDLEDVPDARRRLAQLKAA